MPVIRKGSRQDIVDATINSSEIWKHCKLLKLTQNMRLRSANTNNSAKEIKEFANWILRIGDGDMEAIENTDGDIDIPENLLIKNNVDPLLSLVQFVYPSIQENLNVPNFFEERAILAPRLESVEHLNDFILSFIPGDEKEYLSSDTPCHADENSEIQSQWFTSEFLNDIKCSGIPNHRLRLKARVPVMLMRNIDQANGLCNGTRLQVNDLGKKYYNSNGFDWQKYWGKDSYSKDGFNTFRF